jgi:hypothetical protein
MTAKKRITTKKPGSAKRTAKADTTKKVSQIDAAIQVLKWSRKAMTCKEMVEAMEAKGLWQSPGGTTPDATLYAASDV